jgi:hypothetical protein
MHLEPHQLNALISKFHNKEIKPDIGLNRVSNPDVALNQNTYVVSTRKSKSKSKSKSKKTSSSSSSSSSSSPPQDVQWSIRDLENTTQQPEQLGLPYDEFVHLVFVDRRNNLPNVNHRVQYLPNLNQGETVEKLLALPQRSLEGRRIVDRVKIKVRNKIIEKRGSSLRKVFRSFDTDKDGQVDLQEMEEHIAKLLGTTVTPVEIGMLLMDLDKDGDGTINIREFSNLLGNETVEYGIGLRGVNAAGSRRRKEDSDGDGDGDGKADGRNSSGRHHSARNVRNVRNAHNANNNRRRPSSAPLGNRTQNKNSSTNELTHGPSGASPSKKNLKADRGALRRNQSKEYCLPPKGNVKEMIFPFKELYKTKKIPTKRQHTPYCDTSELIATSRQRQMAAPGESIRRANSLGQLNRPESSGGGGGGGGGGGNATIRSAVGFSFNHQDRTRKSDRFCAKLSRVRKNQDRIESNVVAPSRFEATQKGEQRVQHLIRQRVVYYSKLQERFERDRAMQLAAGV